MILELNSSDCSEQRQDWASEWDSANPPSEALVKLRQISAVIKAQQSIADMFELRQAVMRYTNPLRAKILLFSLLHGPYQHDRVEQVLLLRSYGLDKLLMQTLQTYTRFPVLLGQIQKTARRLESPEAYSQTAAAILRVLKPLYVNSASSRRSSSSLK